jgi:hypothetical protein
MFAKQGELQVLKVTRIIALATVNSIVLTACGGSGSNLMGGNFPSLQICLSSIQTRTGLALRPVVDKPDNVSGYLGDTKRDFACTKKSTGTQGVHWEGWYEAE